MADLRENVTGAEMIAAERQRQIHHEGYSPEHDDRHDDVKAGALIAAEIDRLERSRFHGSKDEHIVEVWRRVVEGSEQAECSCGWKGPKRTYEGALAHVDADTHERGAA